MRFIAVLNEDGGTLRTTDLARFRARAEEILVAAGHSVDVRAVPGSKIESELKRAAAARNVDVVIAGGGDGTISAAAGAMMNSKKALAILPAGTMNLFARSLGVPLDLEMAIQAFATGHMRQVDMASADGRPFVHQFSIGLHAKMVTLRDKMEFGSRLGKIGASMKAAVQTVMNPPSMKVELRIGDTEILARTSGIGVTNNLFGEGHLPYADEPDGGVLGVYVTMARQRSELIKFAFNMARGKWKTNDQVEIDEAEDLEIRLLSSHRKFRSVIDGELCPLEKTTRIRIHPKALTVLVPAVEEAAKAA